MPGRAHAQEQSVECWPNTLGRQAVFDVAATATATSTISDLSSIFNLATTITLAASHAAAPRATTAIATTTIDSPCRPCCAAAPERRAGQDHRRPEGGGGQEVPFRGGQPTGSVTMVGIAYGTFSYPSLCTAQEVMQHESGFDVVYLNFGALHLLHLGDVRPFHTSSDRSCDAFGKASPAHMGRGGDLDGYVHLEENIARDIDAYLAVASLVVVSTPNAMCDSKLNGVFSKSIDEQVVSKCAAGVVAMRPELQGRATEICREGTFNGPGVASLASRVRAATQSAIKKHSAQRVALVDAHSMTEGQCEETEDGRHYSDSIMRQQLVELVKAVAEA
mmetsp:Transcript_22297/g.73576  ORF Transcript_22297/g.73576 Transcript_22297/m.73576 type:complete len:334 (+) Transcript_22297:354-1355(+)